MRKYLSGTGLFSVVMGAYSMLKGMKGQPFNWRIVIAWLSWGLSLAVALGILGENRKAARGIAVVEPELSKDERKYLKRVR